MEKKKPSRGQVGLVRVIRTPVNLCYNNKDWELRERETPMGDY